MEDKDNNLEKFFKKKFTQTPSAEDWNTPDDAIWNQIESKLALDEPKKKRRWLPLLFMLFGLALASYFYTEMRTLHKEINQIRQELKSCQNSAKASNTQETSITELHYAQSEKKLQKNSVVIQKEKLTTKSRNPKTQKNTSPIEFNLSSQTLNTINTMKRGQKPAILLEESSLVKTEFNLKVLQPLPLLEAAAFSLPNRQIIIHIDSIIDYPVLPHKTPKPLQIGFATSFFAWQDRFYGELNAPLSELINGEKTKQNFAFGLQVRKGITKNLSVDAGVLYMQRSQNSSYGLEIPYTTSTEHMSPNGDFENTFSHSLPSGLGYVNTELTLSRAQNSSVTNEEPINIDFAFDHAFQLLQLPLHLSYFPKSMESGFVYSAGINTEFILNNSLNVTQAKSNHTTVKEKNVLLDFPKNQFSRVNFSGSVALGYQYTLAKRLHGLVQIGYQYGLNSPYKTQGYQHKMDAFRVNLGLYRRF